MMKYKVAVISHKRPENVLKIISIVGDCTFYVNNGESASYKEAGAAHVVECGTDICSARNRAIKDAGKMPSIQVSDDLRSLKKVKFTADKRVVESVIFKDVVRTMLEELVRTDFGYGGVAVTTNRLNYSGKDFSYDKLIVCDLICVMPGKNIKFDGSVALKEDYDLTISELIYRGGVVRCDNFLCDFPHRDNKGGANLYRNSKTEGEATAKLFAKWGNHIKNHPTRTGQISLNYSQIKTTRINILKAKL